MAVLSPMTLDDALAALAERPGAQVLAGGTDFMVEVNFGHRRPDDVVALARVDELGGGMSTARPCGWARASPDAS